MIVLNYNEQFENIIKNGFEKFPNHRDMLILAYKWKEQGKTQQSIKDMLLDFCNKQNNQFCQVKYENTINEILIQIQEKQKEIPQNIYFTQNEIDKLNTIDNYNNKKVMFIIMSLIKIKGGDCIYLTSSSTIKQKDIFELANINCSMRNQDLILHELYACGAINVSLKPLLKITSDWISNDCLKKYSFSPNNNLILQYELITGKAIYCECCGIIVHKQNNKMKYCKDCAKKINIEKTKKRKSLK